MEIRERMKAAELIHEIYNELDFIPDEDEVVSALNSKEMGSLLSAISEIRYFIFGPL